MLWSVPLDGFALRWFGVGNQQRWNEYFSGARRLMVAGGVVGWSRRSEFFGLLPEKPVGIWVFVTLEPHTSGYGSMG